MKVDTNMFSAIDIAASGLKAYNKQMEVISSNMANIQTTDAGNGEPFRRLIATFQTSPEESGGVQIGEIAQDNRQFKQILQPGHPDADENGYVMMPNIDWPTELINLNLASRAYQANASILQRYQKMVETSLELLR